MSKNILVISGGYLSEYEVSLNTGNACKDALIKAGYNVKSFSFKNRDEFEQKLIKYKDWVDICFNALHGIFGEDGSVQKILKKHSISYTHSNEEVSKLCMNKIETLKVLKANNFIISKNICFEKDNVKNVIVPFERPYVVKPIIDGSSVGVSIVDKDDKKSLKDIVNDINSSSIMVEKFIDGREFTVGVLEDKALCVTELITSSGFYDYNAKYIDNRTSHVCPANISEKLKNRLLYLAAKAHKVLGCNSISRSDFIYDEKNDLIYIIEINTQPGMTKTSLLPEHAKSVGVSMIDLVDKIVKSAIILK